MKNDNGETIIFLKNGLVLLSRYPEKIIDKGNGQQIRDTNARLDFRLMGRQWPEGTTYQDMMDYYEAHYLNES